MLNIVPTNVLAVDDDEKRPEVSMNLRRFRFKTPIKLIFLFTSVVAWVTSNASLQGGTTLNESLISSELTRRHTLFVPDGYTENELWPLVVNMHGLGGTRSQQMNMARMNPVADENRFLVVYPDAIGRDWNDRQLPQRANDVRYIQDLLADIAAKFSVDPSRVYATGMSQGGLMSYLLANELPNRFAAIASVGGVTPLESPVFGETPDRPLPLLHIHGTADTIVPYLGGPFPMPPPKLNFAPIAETLALWVEQNGCSDEPNVSAIPDTDMRDRSTVSLHEYVGCDVYSDVDGKERSAEVLFYEIVGGGHTWPGGTPLPFGATNRDINASEEIWRFFSRHSLPPPSTGGRGDFDDDGDLDVDDVNALISQINGDKNASFDVTGDATVDGEDLATWVSTLKNTWIGDANLDGEFNSGDLTTVFKGAKYEKDEDAGWADGDWTGDRRFGTSDLTAAFKDGGYERGPRTVVAAVPEPSSWILLTIGIIGIGRLRSCLFAPYS